MRKVSDVLILLPVICLLWGVAGAAGPPAGEETAISGLLARVDSEYAEVRLDALRCLLPLNESLPEDAYRKTLSLLEDPDGRIRATAAGLAFLRGDDDAACPVVLELLSDGDSRCREAAANLCADCLADDPAVLEPVAALIHDEDRYVRCAALDALDVRGDVPPDMVGELAGLLKGDEYNNVRAMAARLLGRFAADDQTALDVLIAALDETDSTVVREVAFALAPLGGQAAPAITKLARYLECPCFHFHYEYLYDVFIELAAGPGNRELITAAAIDYLDNDDDYIVYRACMVLNHNETTDSRVRDQGFAMLQAAGSKRRVLGGLLLTMLFVEDEETITPLATALRDRDKYVRHQAGIALKERGLLVAGVTDELAAVVRDDYYLPARIAAAGAIGVSGTTDPAVIAILEEASKAPEEELAAAALEALEQLGGKQ